MKNNMCLRIINCRHCSSKKYSRGASELDSCKTYHQRSQSNNNNINNNRIFWLESHL